tara:strand:+ start:5865 stop:8072 length:2208 start_codon:yes stop_codon:yes gene_type:complete
MIKKITFSLFTLIILLIIFILYLNFYGVETNKFNNSIKNEIKSYDNRINIELKKVKLLLDIRKLSIKIETKEPIISFSKKKINIEKISSNISIRSYLSNNYGVKNLSIITKENQIKNLIYIARSINNTPGLLILSQMIKEGNIKLSFDIEFDDAGKIKSNYDINGIIENGKIQLLKNGIFEKVKLKVNYKENNIKFENIDFNIDNIKFNSDYVEIKRIKSDYFIKGNFKNNKSNINTKLLNLIKIKQNKYFKIDNSKFENIGIFSFKLNKNFKLKDLVINSQLKIYDLDYTKSIKDLEKYLPDYKNKINLKKINLNYNYDKKKINIKGDAIYKLNNNEDKIIFNIINFKDIYDFDLFIELDKNKFAINEISYFKDSIKNASLNIAGKYQKEKKLSFKKIEYNENENKIFIYNLELDSNNKIKNFKKASFNYLTTNNILNRFEITYYHPNYTITGKVYDAIKLIKDITDTETKTNFFDIFKEINSKININLKEVYLDNNNIAKNFNGSLKLKKNKIIDLDLYSNFSEDDNFFITIKMSDSNQKITTLYSDRAVPFVKNFKFIKGFESGVLDYNSRENNEIVKSHVKIYDFKVKEVPILAKLLTLASLQGIADLLTGEGIRFDEFEMNYSTKDKVITIDEIYSIGPSISILMEGYVQSNELISLRGTLVPATTINKLIGKIKVIGDILVGKKKGEGVFGVSFKIKGPPKNLKTTVNPIKTLTPRFITRTLEKIKKTN